MPDTLRYVSRIARLPLVDADGATIGRIEDVVVAPSGGEAPRVLGFVAAVQRRHIFVNAARIVELDPIGLRLRGGTIDVAPFRKREGELLALEDLVGRRVGDSQVVDLSIKSHDSMPHAWVVHTVALSGRRPLARRRTPRIVPWNEVSDLFDVGADAAEVARFREMRPADVARRIRALPLAQRRRLAEIMEDERLADLLEELPEDEQIRIIEGLDIDRAADVLEAMDPDDAADLLGELPADERAKLLEAMEDEEATPLRRLLSYGEATAGGLMTPEPVIVERTVTVAEALARVRDLDLPVTVATEVFVVRPPTSPPTGQYLGAIGFQQMLRTPPSTPLGEILPERTEWVGPEMSQIDVAGRLAAYDLVAIAVCDQSRRLLGVVTIDDVMDHLLPRGWRRRVLRDQPVAAL